LQTAMALTPWSTPRESDGAKGSQNQSFGAGGTPLPAQMATATWRSPNTVDARGGTRKGSGQVQLTHQMTDTGRRQIAPWATPTLFGNSNRKGASPGSGDGLATQLLDTGGMGPGGPDPSGSGATMPKRVGSPTPAHPCWLMGCEAAFLYCAPTPSELKALKASPRSKRKRAG
jgi:hypothetical protein